MNVIRSLEAEYNVQSFFRGLPKIRKRTFTTRTIKHSFQTAGMWPVSFKAVQKKLKEYEKKKKDAGLEFLEYESESEPEEQRERKEESSSLSLKLTPRWKSIPSLPSLN